MCHDNSYAEGHEYNEVCFMQLTPGVVHNFTKDEGVRRLCYPMHYRISFLLVLGMWGHDNYPVDSYSEVP